jgi:hypothetical protein
MLEIGLFHFKNYFSRWKTFKISINEYCEAVFFACESHQIVKITASYLIVYRVVGTGIIVFLEIPWLGKYLKFSLLVWTFYWFQVRLTVKISLKAWCNQFFFQKKKKKVKSDFSWWDCSGVEWGLWLFRRCSDNPVCQEYQVITNFFLQLWLLSIVSDPYIFLTDPDP